jgi:hypothetical protein
MLVVRRPALAHRLRDPVAARHDVVGEALDAGLELLGVDGRGDALEHVVALAARMDARPDDRLRAGAAELDDHGAVDGIAELPRAGAVGHVPAVARLARGAARDARGGRQEAVRGLARLLAVEVDVDEPARRLAEEDADVGVTGEVPLGVVGRDAELLPAGNERSLGAVGNGDRAPAARDAREGRVDGGGLLHQKGIPSSGTSGSV